MKKVRAFTLIELLVVILILGILLAIAIPAYLASIQDSREKTALSNTKSVATAIQALYTKKGGTNYGSVTAAEVSVELNGLPDNPCTANVETKDAAGLTAGYGVTLSGTMSTVTVTPQTDNNLCTAATLTAGAVKLGQ